MQRQIQKKCEEEEDMLGCENEFNEIKVEKNYMHLMLVISHFSSLIHGILLFCVTRVSTKNTRWLQRHHEPFMYRSVHGNHGYTVCTLNGKWIHHLFIKYTHNRDGIRIIEWRVKAERVRRSL
jgi:N-dimethylarginine dimethylaminohydrolase